MYMYIGIAVMKCKLHTCRPKAPISLSPCNVSSATFSSASFWPGSLDSYIEFTILDLNVFVTKIIIKVPVKWKIIAAYLKGFSKKKKWEWHFSFWNIFGISPLCMQPPTVTVTLKEFSGKYSLDPLTYQCTNQKKGGGYWLGARIWKESL